MRDPIEKEILEALYIKQGKTIREIADLLGWKKDKVHWWLQKYDIKRDKRIRKTKITDLSLEYLEREFDTKSKKQVAKDLGISRATLYNYLTELKKK